MNMEHVWKVGDKGECVDVGASDNFTVGKIYEVLDIGDPRYDHVLFQTDSGGMDGWPPYSTNEHFKFIGTKQACGAVWTDKHYDNKYQLSEEDIKNGFINLDVYFVSKQWKIGSRDESGALWHCLKTIARFGDKNSKEREIKALHAQVKCLAKLEGVELD